MNSIIIIPTYNEIKNIRNLVEEILKLDYHFQILIIDGNSPDGTGGIADELSKKYKEAYVIHRERKLGIGSAYILGFKFALERNFDYIITMDADFSHQPKYLSALIEEIDRGDVVLGSRYTKDGAVVNWGIYRKILSKGANLFVKNILRSKINDFTSGFRCYKRKVLESINLDRIFSNGYSFQIELLYKCEQRGCNIREVPIVFTERLKGKSKFSGIEVIKAVWIIFKLRLGR